MIASLVDRRARDLIDAVLSGRGRLAPALAEVGEDAEDAEPDEVGDRDDLVRCDTKHSPFAKAPTSAQARKTPHLDSHEGAIGDDAGPRAAPAPCYADAERDLAPKDAGDEGGRAFRGRNQ